MRREGWQVSDKRVCRLYSKEGLANWFQLSNRRRVSMRATRVVEAQSVNHVWACDTMTDQDERGREIIWLAAVDEYSRVCRLLTVDRAESCQPNTTAFANALKEFGPPQFLRIDNNRLWKSNQLRRLLANSHVRIKLTTRGCPWENGFVESFFGKLRNEFTNRVEFTSIEDAREQGRLWWDYYNNDAPMLRLAG